MRKICLSVIGFYLMVLHAFGQSSPEQSGNYRNLDLRVSLRVGELYLMRDDPQSADSVFNRLIREADRRADRAAFMDGEEVGHPEVVEQPGNPGAGVEQLDAGGRTSLGKLQDQPGHHAQEGAVHQLAVGKVEEETGMALVAEAQHQAPEINAARARGAAGDAHADEVVGNPHGQAGRRSAHALRGRNVGARPGVSQGAWTRAVQGRG